MLPAGGFRYRLIDTDGNELEIVSYPVANIKVGETLYVAGGRPVQVLDKYDDEQGQEGDVQATLVIDAWESGVVPLQK
ncbi:MAG: hypothetical protein C5B48_09560 [Candidatus Rokuibacteriota bacterium]|nr:MAG: hypothetical protein C5B48_09560 [Candidatus Rokubacteria bacterium]